MLTLIARIGCCLSLLIVANGCSDPMAPGSADVQGVVTLDGQPLPGASVWFSDADGEQSSGITDESGHYRLAMTASQFGAKLGSNTVGISKIVQENEQSLESIPFHYNIESDLNVDVSDGGNVHDFALETGGFSPTALPGYDAE